MLLLSLNLFRLISSQHYSTPPYIVASEKKPRRRITLQLHRTLYTQICALVKWKINFSCDFSNKNTIFYYFHGKLLSSLDNTAAMMYNCIMQTEQKEEKVMAWNFFFFFCVYHKFSKNIYSDSGKNQAENLLGRISRGFQNTQRARYRKRSLGKSEYRGQSAFDALR